MEKLIREIYSKMDTFKQSSSCGTRQYLAAAKVLYDIENRIVEMENLEQLDKRELEEMSRKVDVILQNCGIASRIRENA